MYKNASVYAVIAGLVMSLASTAGVADDRIKQIKDRGVLRACHAEALPWGAKDPKTGDWVGTDIEAAKHLATTMGVKIEHVDSQWATLIPSLETNKCDIVMAPMFRTAERAMRVLFANPAGYETQAVAVGQGADFQSYKDIDKSGKVVAVLSGTADEAFANRFFKKAQVKPFVSDKLSTIFLEVANKRADAVLTDSSTVKRFIKENPGMSLRLLEDQPLNPQGYSYAVLPGQQDFVSFINVWQETLDNQGLREQWYMKYSE